jgi:hypothetical protein
MRNTESISLMVATKVISELRARGYGATPVNTSGKEGCWDIEKICVTKSGRDLCDINCKNNNITYIKVSDQYEVRAIFQMIDKFCEQGEIFTNAPSLKIKGLERYKLLAEYNDAVLAVWG